MTTTTMKAFATSGLLAITMSLVALNAAAQDAPAGYTGMQTELKPFRWPSKTPEGCPFPASETLAGIEFTGRYRNSSNADTRSPTWVDDGNLYSPWTDSYVWYYGTYSIWGAAGLGPLVGIRHSSDNGKTRVQTTCTPTQSLFGEDSAKSPVKFGGPHFVDCGKIMQHSRDGKANFRPGNPVGSHYAMSLHEVRLLPRVSPPVGTADQATPAAPAAPAAVPAVAAVDAAVLSWRRTARSLALVRGADINCQAVADPAQGKPYFHPLAKAGVPLFAIHGDVDLTVPLEANSGLLKERYPALGGTMEIVVAHGQGHNMWSGFFQSEALVNFGKQHAK